MPVGRTSGDGDGARQQEIEMRIEDVEGIGPVYAAANAVDATKSRACASEI